MKYGQLENVRKYYTIGEVSSMTGLPSYVLRAWEEAIPLLKPPKNRGGKRSYREKDVEMVRRIQRLVREEGHSLSGALRELLEAKYAPEEVRIQAASDAAEREKEEPVAQIRPVLNPALLRSLHEELREALLKLRP